MSEIDDTLRLENLLAAVLPEPTPMVATCPTDGEPLVMTMIRAGAEFHCLTCGGWFGFLAPIPKAETPELLARLAEVEARFGREQAR